MHDEVFDAAQDSAYARDSNASAASSPSEAYANLTLDSRESNGLMATDSDPTIRNTTHPEHTAPRPPPRSSSPAKRLHSDMDGTGKEHMEVEAPAENGRRNSGQSSPRATKPLPLSSQRGQRGTSVDMLDAPTNGTSATSSETTSGSNRESTATSLSTRSSPSSSSAKAPSLDDQVSKVMAIHARPLTDGQEGYVISERWLARVFARTTENIKQPQLFDKSAVEGEIGPADNSDLVDPGTYRSTARQHVPDPSPTATLVDELSDQNGEEFIPLRSGLTMGQDFEILPAEAWELIISWYGLKEGTPVIRRYVHDTALDELSENLQYEIYPPVFTIRKVRKVVPTSAITQDISKRSSKLVASRSDGYVNFLRSAKKAAGISLTTKVRVWRILHTAPTDATPPQPSGMLTPESSPRNGSPVQPSEQRSAPLILDLDGFLALEPGTERELVTGKDETANEKYNGHATLHIVGLAEDQVLVLEEEDEKGDYVSDSSRKVGQKNGLQPGNKIGGKANKGLQSATTSGRNSPAPSGMVTRGRTRTGRTRGTVGLSNLGNTCYMNSALQCIRSVEELSWYFIQGDYKREINADNPLGHKGAIAKTYAGLLASIYDVNGTSSFSPKNFKMALGKAQPLFSGYGQQDSQEFLSFLVDGLHEDLNRIKKKPYTENPESDDNTVNDPAAIKALGDKFKEIHRSRNDSVAMDLFNGFYKNTMVCPDCEKVSITFDPFSLVTLQLPIEQTWQHDIVFVPIRGPLWEMKVDIDKNATIKALKEYIAKRFKGVKADRLMGAEVYTHKFYRVLDDKKSIVECNIGQRDIIYFYELDDKPTNWPPRKKKQQQRSMFYNAPSSEEDIPDSNSALGDKILVPIFHRSQSSSYRGQTWALVQWPSYIVLTRDEAKDYDTILKKVLGKVAQMTTRPILTEYDSTFSGQSNSGSDLVLTTEEDASPDGDPRVQDGSVSGEDMVEVTMTDTAHASGTPEDEIPEVLKSGTFVAPGFRHLFELKTFKPGKELVPTGWSSLDSNKTYEPISKRIRVPEDSRETSVQSMDENSNASSDADDIPQFSAAASLEMADRSSDEDEIPSIEPADSFSRGGRNTKKNRRKNEKRQNKKNRTQWSKKGKDRFSQQPSQPLSDGESDDDEGLVRLGEAIVVDWTPESYDALFGGNSEADERGRETYKDPQPFRDPELEAKQAKRAARKKHGLSLEECFAETSKSEVLSEDNAWFCGRCKELRRATKTLEIWTAPDILVIHLKRFSAHRTFRDKIEALVDCPIEGLDLSGKVGLPEGKDLIYDLFAVDNHYGGLGGGHYTATAKNFFDGKWYDYNGMSTSRILRDNH
jgi:ubiquitin carboxyl-terminal hydrolase 4/11/15